MKNCKKALSYCGYKWDLKTGTPIDSGTTIDDVVNYVQRKIYIDYSKGKDSDNHSISSSDNDEIQVNDDKDIPSVVENNGDSETGKIG